MPDYRVYFLNPDGHISRPSEIIECADDQEATQKARQLVDGHDFELWQGRRRIILLPHKREK